MVLLFTTEAAEIAENDMVSVDSVISVVKSQS